MAKTKGPSSKVSAAQRDHVQAIVDRLDLTLPEGAFDSVRWVKNFLDVFSYDPKTNSGGYAAVRMLLVRYLEGCDLEHIGKILGVTTAAVVQAIAVLDASGYRVSQDEADDDPSRDPELESLAYQEWEIEDPDVRRPRPPFVRNRDALLKLLIDPEALDGDEIPIPGSNPRPSGEPPYAPRPIPKVPQTSIGLAAFRYLESADFATRLKWTARATEAGVALPPAATARENLHLWVDHIAEAIVSEERLIVRDKTADR